VKNQIFAGEKSSLIHSSRSFVLSALKSVTEFRKHGKEAEIEASVKEEGQTSAQTFAKS
jgi:hypothetical protein